MSLSSTPSAQRTFKFECLEEKEKTMMTLSRPTWIQVGVVAEAAEEEVGVARAKRASFLAECSTMARTRT